MKLNIQAFLNSLVFMGEGMLGIFAVMLIIIPQAKEQIPAHVNKQIGVKPCE